MAQSKWKCTNYDGNCEAAFAGSEVVTAKGAEFICPVCGQHGGIEVIARRISTGRYLAGALMLAIVGFVVWLLLPRQGPTPNKPITTSTPVPALPQPLIDQETGLFKRILTRPQANLLANADANSSVIRANIPDFTSFYVYNTSGGSPGLYQVGSTDQLGGEGWIKTDDAVEWKHTLVVEFTPIERRQPVLMFDDIGPLDQILSPDQERASKAQAMYLQFKDGRIPDHLIGKEPNLFLGATKQFYLLPVLDWKDVNMGGQEGRKLKLTAAARGRGQIAAAELLKDIRRDPTTIRSLGQFKLDLVFVMDSTGTMQPYFDATVNVMRQMSEWLRSNSDPAASIRFGLWCYQDSPTLPGIQYRTRNFTEKLQDFDGFTRVLSTIKANKETPDPYAEDVFAGVMDALNKTAWTEAAARIVILVGDAPGNDVHDVGNQYKIEAPQVGQSARDHGARMLCIHLRDFTHQTYAAYHSTTEKQFRDMAEKSGAPGAYLRIDIHDLAKKKEAYAPVLAELTNTFATQIGDFLNGNNKVDSGPKDSPKTIAHTLLQGAVIDWVSARSEVKGVPPSPPRDITAWAVDRDLIDPSVQSLEPKILLTKNQLSELKIRLSRIIDQAKNAQIMNQDFIKQLRETAVATTQTASTGPDSKARPAQSNPALLPKYLEKLPYKSELMSVSSEFAQTLTIDEMTHLIASLESKISYYTEAHDNPSKWVPLNDKAPEGEHVSAIPLSQLP